RRLRLSFLVEHYRGDFRRHVDTSFLTADIHPPTNPIPAGLNDDGSVLTAATTHGFSIPSLLRLRGLKNIDWIVDLQQVLTRTRCASRCKQFHKQAIFRRSSAPYLISACSGIESCTLRGLMD